MNGLYAWVIISIALPLGLYVVWMTVNFTFSQLAKSCSPKPITNCSSTKIAILYTVCDDFQSIACESLINQRSSNFDVYILDDSTQLKERSKIDQWSINKPVTIVRRKNRVGYKAGNINNWLINYGDSNKYSHLLVVDSDSILPEDFCGSLFSIAQQGSYAFVQGCHTGDAKLTTCFQRLLHPQVECEWLNQLPGRNLFGMPYTMGHGVLICIDDLLKAGGYPNLVSEDLALTAIFAAKGRFGIIASSVLAKEEFPPTYLAYWRRRKRWIAADAQLVVNMFKILNMNKLGFLAKLDLWLRELRLGAISAFWFLLIIISVLGFLDLKSDYTYNSLIWIPVIIVSILPMCPPFFRGKYPMMRGVTYLLLMPFVGVATSALNPVCTWQGAQGRLSFQPTSSRFYYSDNHNYLIIWEYLSGIIILLGGIFCENYIMLAVALAIASSPIMRKNREKYIMIAGGLLFSCIIGFQICYDIYLGYTPLEHFLIFVGIACYSL